MQRFEGEVVGTGTYSRVIKVSPTRVVKVVPIRPAVGKAHRRGPAEEGVCTKTLSACLREAHLHSTMAELSPTYVARVDHVLMDEAAMAIAQEYLGGGNLAEYVASRSSPARAAAQELRVLCRTLRALADCHAAGICYGDLKLENVMLGGDGGDSKLIDFGCAEVCGGHAEGCCGRLKGTIPYMAPELLLRSGHGQAVDVWAFGVLAARLLHPEGASPFPSITVQTWTAAFTRQYAAPQLHEGLPPALRAALRAALAVRAADRPRAAELLDVFANELLAA
jgi:serine/threonine protein kinase